MSASRQPPPQAAGALGRAARVLFALVFMIPAFIAVSVTVHLISGHSGNTVFNTGQSVDAAVLGIPSSLLAVAVLPAAIYTAATGKRGRLPFWLSLVALGLFGVMYLIAFLIK